MGKTITKYKECYFCGAPATTKEHIPPKQLFKGLVVTRFTVPACTQHNNTKSFEDEAIIKGFLMGLVNKSVNPYNGLETLNVVERARPHFSQVKKMVQLQQIIPNNLVEIDPNLPFIDSAIDVKNWMRQLIAGLFYVRLNRYEACINWRDAEVYSPDYLEAEERLPYQIDKLAKKTLFQEKLRTELNGLPWQAGWQPKPGGYPQTIFRFDICYYPSGIAIGIRLKFYTQYTWFIYIESTSAVISELKLVER